MTDPYRLALLMSDASEYASHPGGDVIPAFLGPASGVVAALHRHRAQQFGLTKSAPTRRWHVLPKSAVTRQKVQGNRYKN
jgi:hypothetical protein